MTFGLLSPAGRIAVVGFDGVNAFGTAETAYHTRIGDFTGALPQQARLMRLVDQVGPDQYRVLQDIRAGQRVPVTEGRLLSGAETAEVFGPYVDRNIGIRTAQPEDTEDGQDLQRHPVLVESKSKPGDVINGRPVPVGTRIYEPAEKRPAVVHAGYRPGGWDPIQEMGLEKVHPYYDLPRGHKLAIRMLAGALLRMGVPYSVIADVYEREKRGVSAGPGMSPGMELENGMSRPGLNLPLRTDQLARYVSDNAAFLIAKILDAGFASTRLGACNTGICNAEIMVDQIRLERLLFGALGAFESAITLSTIEGFVAQKALADNNSVAQMGDHPSLISMPGLVGRAGFVMGEGGAILFVEEMESALERGAIIYGEIMAARTAVATRGSIDAAAPTRGIELAMRRALEDAARLDGVSPKKIACQIRWVSEHGTSTPAGDTNGAACVDAEMRRAGRSVQDPLFMTYTKGGPRLEGIPTARRVGGGGVGHDLGGAAAMALAESFFYFSHGVLPPAVASLDRVDPAIANARHIVFPTSPLRGDWSMGIVTALGFGDTNGAVIVRAFDPDRYEGGRRANRAEHLAWVRERQLDLATGRMKLGQLIPSPNG